MKMHYEKCNRHNAWPFSDTSAGKGALTHGVVPTLRPNCKRNRARAAKGIKIDNRQSSPADAAIRHEMIQITSDEWLRSSGDLMRLSRRAAHSCLWPSRMRSFGANSEAVNDQVLA